MGGISLLAASLVIAFIGFGWLNAVKEGVFDVWAFITGHRIEETVPAGETIKVDPDFDGDLNDLDAELNDLLHDSESELNALEQDL